MFVGGLAGGVKNAIGWFFCVLTVDDIVGAVTSMKRSTTSAYLSDSLRHILRRPKLGVAIAEFHKVFRDTAKCTINDHE
jgi:hypothetical protein